MLLIWSITKINNLMGVSSITRTNINPPRPLRLWSNAVVPYQIDTQAFPVNSAPYNRIMQAINHWNEHTVMRFIPRWNFGASDHARFVLGPDPANPDRCNAFTGANNPATIRCNAQNNAQVGTLLHELGHTVGLLHEMQRPDRDQFVTVHQQNIDQNFAADFALIASNNAIILTRYDYSSIMHYNSRAFSVNGRRTITGPRGVSFGQREALSDSDVRSVSNLYRIRAKYVVVWSDGINDPRGYNIRMVGYSDQGKPCFRETLVNTNQRGVQRHPDVAVSGSGNHCMVVWEDDSDGNGQTQILGKLYSGDGTTIRTDFTINTNSRGNQFRPQVAMTNSGRSIVVWEDDPERNRRGKIMFKGIGRTGHTELADGFADRNSNFPQSRPNVAMNKRGEFAVVWASRENGRTVIKMRAYDTRWRPKFAAKRVATVTNAQSEQPGVTISRTGNVVVVWEQNSGNQNGIDIKMRGYDATGRNLFPTRYATPDRTGHQYTPDVCYETNGRFVVTWTDGRQGGGRYHIKANKFDSLGKPLPGPHRQQIGINSIPAQAHYHSKVGVQPNGRFCVAWLAKHDEEWDRDDVMINFFSGTSVSTSGDIRVHKDQFQQQGQVAIATPPL